MVGKKQASKRPPLLLQVVVWYTLLVTVLGAGWLLTLQLTPPVTAQQHVKHVITTRVIGGNPTELSIASLNMRLPVLPGAFDAIVGDWQITPTNAHYAVNTAVPNNWRGSTVMYGHNNRLVFGPTKNLQPSDEAIVSTISGRKFIYAYSGSEIVAPNQTGILAIRTGQPRLVLITCEGIWNENRRLMYFDFKEVR